MQRINKRLGTEQEKMPKYLRVTVAAVFGTRRGGFSEACTSRVRKALTSVGHVRHRPAQNGPDRQTFFPLHFAGFCYGYARLHREKSLPTNRSLEMETAMASWYKKV
ncbi:hypothetical protein CEXT_485691 [Caerostris extrusa]|uniref:Uncharacterized protein n=1 Tax=Caerostris extrusa TaxID=172846 RepID=A0AAV4VYF2_CAEEX|nr:hypothetical protein CEXT_485691 [Caerostris extrusa]